MRPGSALQGSPVSPDGRYVYAANRSNPGNISAYRIVPDGSLTPVPGSPFTAGIGPQALAITPDGRPLYAVNGDSGNVSGFNIARDGSLTAAPGSPVIADFDPRALAVSPDGKYLYEVNRQNFVLPGDVFVYRIANDGSLSEIAGSPYTAGLARYGIAISANGANVYVLNAIAGDISAYTAAANGSLTPVAGSPFPTFGSGPTGIAVTPDGASLYSSNFGSNRTSCVLAKCCRS